MQCRRGRGCGMLINGLATLCGGLSVGTVSERPNRYHRQPHSEAIHSNAPHSEAIHSNAPHSEAIHSNAPHSEAIHSNANRTRRRRRQNGAERLHCGFACDAYDVSAKAFTIDRVGRHDIVVVHVVHRTCELLGCSGQVPTTYSATVRLQLIPRDHAEPRRIVDTAKSSQLSELRRGY